MELKISREWCLRMAELEGDHEVGAGAIARDPDWADRLGIKCAHPAGADQCAGCPHYQDPKAHPECAYTTP